MNLNSYLTNGVYIIPCEVKDFAIEMVDMPKKSAGKNVANAGFFGNYSENQEPFTLPVAHVRCDYKAESQWTKKYCAERGKFDGEKYSFDSSKWSYANPCYNKALSSLIVNNGVASIKEISSLESGDYIISGIPIIRGGVKVNMTAAQGWDSSSLRATWHTFIGLKKNDNRIYIIGWESKTFNLVSTGEAFEKFFPLGFTDVIKLDGGGSYYLNVNDETSETYENRRINSIIKFTPVPSQEDEDSKYNEWVKFMTRFRSELAQKAPTLPEQVEKAISLGLTDGSRPCDFTTREEVMTMVKNVVISCQKKTGVCSNCISSDCSSCSDNPIFASVPKTSKYQKG